MISLSRIIKATHYAASEESIVLSVKAPPVLLTEEPAERLQEKHAAVQHAEEEAHGILRDAEEMAEKIISDASREVEEMRRQAMEEIGQWWEQKRQEAEQMALQVREEARREGYAQGLEEGKAVALQEEQGAIQLARDVLSQAYATKEQIIAEAEPFLVGLSAEIAKKIIGDELSSDPDKIVAVARRVLRRSRVHGQITVCVNHRYFDYVQEHREQFLAVLDGQAELSIYPDYTVQDEGCVIRTPFGSVDARIDTQLSEIKQALLEIARGSETDERP